MRLLSAVIAFTLISLATAPSVNAATQELTYDSFNNATNISYDSLNRILVKNFSSGQHNYTYDADYLGTLTNVTFSNGSVSYEYDDKLRVIKEVRIIDGLRFEKLIDYDSADRPVKQAGNPGTVAAYIYGGQGQVDRIVGFVNATRHNAFGNVINRNYSNGKTTNLTYDGRNARLTRINTDTAQNMLFSYDAVGNIILLNDTANGRQQVMAYDHLDRLLNTSINDGQSFAYRYDALGNLLRISRHGLNSTMLSYEGKGPVHAPSRIITGTVNSDLTSTIVLLNTSNKNKVIEFRMVNRKNSTIATTNFTIEFGDQTKINSTSNINLLQNETAVVLVEHNYSKGGFYAINITADNPASLTDLSRTNAKFGIVLASIDITTINITNTSYEFSIQNELNEASQDVSWNCNNGLSSGGQITVNATSKRTIQLTHNYSSAGTTNLNCSVISANGNDSIKTSLEIRGIEIEAYNRTFSDENTTLVKFNITNRFYPRPVDWRIASDGQTFTGTTATIATDTSVIITQEINHTTPGKKSIELNITSDRNLSDSLSDTINLKALEIENYNSRNITLASKAFDFFVKNYWTSNLSSNWSITDPSIANSSVYLDTGESIWIYAEANYAQGIKKPTVNAHTGSIIKTVAERFASRLIEILNYNTIAEGTASTIIEALIRTNTGTYNVSWTFQTGEETATGSNFTAVNNSEDFVLIKESRYSNSSVYNTSLFINSSSINETARGIIIT